MIEYESGVVVMNLVDLEHCGFEHDTFDWELRASGIDDPAASWPVALLVNFAGGAMVGPGTTSVVLARMKEANGRFQALRERVCESASQ